MYLLVTRPKVHKKLIIEDQKLVARCLQLGGCPLHAWIDLRKRMSTHYLLNLVPEETQTNSDLHARVNRAHHFLLRDEVGGALYHHH